MSKKLIIVTPPDYYHANATRILLINPTSEEKEEIQEWLKKHNEFEIILYLYNNNHDIIWLLNKLEISDSVYFNVDNSEDISYYYSSYIISFPKVTFKTKFDYSIINNDKVEKIDEFIQRQHVG